VLVACCSYFDGTIADAERRINAAIASTVYVRS
jgi:hypothetical protein